jgi:hypothetical protein
MGPPLHADSIMIRAASIIPLLVLLLPPAIGQTASPEVEVIQLTRPEDIRDASTVDQAIVGLSNKVMECVQAKLAPAGECFCRYPRELSRVRNAYEGALRQHPGWKNKSVSYTLESRTYAVSLGGLDRQLQTKCPQGK